MRNLKRIGFILAFVVAAMAGFAESAEAEQRLALVVGQGAYANGQLPTTVNDAGLVAQTLTSAGFEVIQGRDLNATDLRRVVRDFLDKAQAAEPDSAVVVYLSGYGIQLEGENYLLPVDARIEREADVPLEGFRLSDLIRSLSGAPAQTRIIIADMGRDYPFPSTSDSIAKGLALVEPPSGFLVAFSSAPNIPVIDQKGPYSAYATALVEMMRQPGMRIEDVFARTRLRTHEATNGTQTPWHAANLSSTFVFFEPAETASAEPPAQERRIEAVPPEEAYSIAVERDTVQDYQEFLRRYPDHPLARRVTAILAARREAVVWRRTLNRNSAEAYWTYLRRYRNGPHAPDARRRLARLSAPMTPPSSFEEVIYDDLPPPMSNVEDVEVVEAVTIIRDAPPPPRAPVYLLPERDYDDDYVVDVISEPPPPPMMAGVLPVPMPIPIPYRARPPRMYYQPIAPITPSGPVAIQVAPPPQRAALPPGAAGGPRVRPGRFQQGQPAIPGQPGMLAPAQPLPVAVAPAAPAFGPRPAGAPPRLPSRPIPLQTQGWGQPGGAVAPPPPQPAPTAAAPAPLAPRQALPTPPPAAPPGAIPGWSGRPSAPPPAAAPGQPLRPGASPPGPGRSLPPPVPSAAAPVAPAPGGWGGPREAPRQPGAIPGVARPLPGGPIQPQPAGPPPNAALPNRGGFARPVDRPLPVRPAPPQIRESARPVPPPVQPRAQPQAPPQAGPGWGQPRPVPQAARPAPPPMMQPRPVPQAPRPAPPPVMQARPAPPPMMQPRPMPAPMAQPRPAPAPMMQPRPMPAPAAQPRPAPGGPAARPGGWGRPACGVPGAPPCP